MKKVYQHNAVTFGSNGRVWIFNHGTYQFRTPLPGGVDTAHKVAHIIQVAFNRTKGKRMDNRGREAIRQLVSSVKQ